MTSNDETRVPNAGPEPGTKHEQRTDAASGQRLGPPGNGERDEQAIAAGTERLEQAGGGH